MSRRHQSRRRRNYGRRLHEVRERRGAPDVDLNLGERGQGRPGAPEAVEDGGGQAALGMGPA